MPIGQIMHGALMEAREEVTCDGAVSGYHIRNTGEYADD
jgi:hypothetical protein